MLKTAQNKTDLMALLSQVKKGGQKGGIESALGELGVLLEGGAKPGKNFADVLASEGALQEVSAEDLLSFFRENLKENMSAEKESSILKSLGFDGKIIKPEDIISQLAKNKEAAPLSQKEMTQFLKADQLSLPTSKGKEKAALKEGIKSAEDFMAQRKALHGKRIVTDANGQHKIQRVSPAVNQYQKENKVIDNRLIKVPNEKSAHLELRQSEGAQRSNGSQYSQMNSELAQILQQSGQADQGETMQMASKGKQIDIINLSNIQSANKTELINQVSNYIQQSYVTGQDSIELLVDHNELGQFRINATKAGPGQQVDLEIQTLTQQGKQFFAENESELIKSLTQNGVKVSDLKLVGQKEFLAFAENRSLGSEQGHQSQGRGESSQSNGQQGQRQFSSQQEQGRERRRQMWQQAQEQMMSA